ncbi:MAG TPA: hypothetical protein VMV97_12980 [Sulfuriferula sp.]|nr:hypothetical protein [Sulfuriferula sp.]
MIYIDLYQNTTWRQEHLFSTEIVRTRTARTEYALGLSRIAGLRLSLMKVANPSAPRTPIRRPEKLANLLAEAFEIQTTVADFLVGAACSAQREAYKGRAGRSQQEVK